MTKSEANAIAESTSRALRVLQGVDMPWGMMSKECAEKVGAAVKVAVDEVARVHGMAHAELGKR